MSVDKPRRKNTIWHIEFVTTKAAQAPIAAKLASFAQHKTVLLDNLYQAYERGLKSEPFDPDSSWRKLSRIAEEYFWDTVMKDETMPTADRSKRLRQLAKFAGQTRELVNKAMRDDVGYDLFRGWCAEANISTASVVQNRNFSVLTDIADEIERVAAILATLEAAASGAAVDLRSGRGRPKETAVLPRRYIYALAHVYRGSTGLKPGAGKGPFARFVYAFLTAVGQRVLEYHSVVDMIKDARSSEEGSSVFA
jgi:hypothetical protein